VSQIFNLIVSTKDKINKIALNVKLTAIEKVLVLNLKNYFTFKLQSFSRKLNKSEHHHIAETKKHEDLNGNDDDEPNLTYPNFQLSQVQRDILNRDEEYIKARDQEIEKILKQMKEISRLYYDLADMVVEQGELIDRIEETIIEAQVNVGKGVDLINQATNEEGKTNSKLWRTILIAVVILVIIIIALLFLTKQTN